MGCCTHSDVDHGIHSEPVLASLADHLGAVGDTRKETTGEDYRGCEGKFVVSLNDPQLLGRPFGISTH